MNNKKLIFNLTILVIGIAIFGTLTGCVGYVDGGGDVAVVGGPDVYIFGGHGGYDRGRDVHAYSARGATSRAAAHPSGGAHGGRH